jgi:hypothetical protein
MKQLVLGLALALAVIGGAVTISAVASNPAHADGGGNGGGH